MTDPVDSISRIRETDRNSGRGSSPKGEKRKRRESSHEEDSVDISGEARDRATGKRRKGILEYIGEQ
ncbi:MAG TPA: hypothetical protein PLN25_07915 [Deltaproteobacteria bacterium]|nr:hypothetical protein [Deltaproteobacteria bacterium]HQB39271.1 hypothetical protein [Deltaproteobacteria bacterium]